jgi:hypothetical protein
MMNTTFCITENHDYKLHGLQVFVDVLEAFVFLDMNGDDLIQRHELNIQLPKLGLSLKIDQVIGGFGLRTSIFVTMISMITLMRQIRQL